MRLKLDLCGIDTQLKITDYHFTRKNEDPYDNWCDVEMSLVSRQVNVHPGGSILMSDEVLEICNILEEVLIGNRDEEFSLDFIEPDLKLKFYPTKDIDHAFCELVINLWGSDGSLSANSLSVGLDKDDLMAMWTYLKYVTKQIQKDDPSIKELIDKGNILPEYAI